MFSFLSNHGVLGINARNLLYVEPFNPKSATRFADDKLKTKAYLTARGIPAAKIYGRIENREQLRAFDFSKLPNECVLKPNYGFGGEGILILKGRNASGQFLRSGKKVVTEEELFEHIEDILDGKFSLSGRLDTAFFEQILTPHDCFMPFRPVGLPDIRVIVFNLVPVMAMLRIPTSVSDGKANLHLGGIGLGIDIAKGVTTHAAQYHHMLDELPHGGSPSGHVIPYWDDILLICSRIQQITNIGYLAVDIAIDQAMGPAILEVNARAGLNVQIANLAPLQSRLKRVQGLNVLTPKKGVRMGQDLFGEKVKKEQHADSKDRPVLGIQETIVITGSGHTFREPCLIASEQERTEFSEDLLQELLQKRAIEPEDTTANTYRVKYTLGGKKFQTLVGVLPPTFQEYRVRVGRRDLSDFLIDPTKKTQNSTTKSAVQSDLRAVDKLLAQYDQDLLILKYLKPINLDEERQRLEEDMKYNPIFTYRAFETDISEAKDRLSREVNDESLLGVLLEKKRKELLLRIDLLQARGDAERFTKASFALFGKPTSSLLKAASAELHNRKACDLSSPESAMIGAEQAKVRFEKVLQYYSLHDWNVTVRPKLVADCTVGGNNVYLREDALFAPEHIEALIKHEIETHVLTAENGAHQPYALFRRGCAGYLDTQEGLAIYNQNRIYTDEHEKRFNPARNVLGVAFTLEHSFAETRLYLQEELGYTPYKSLTQAIAMKRGLNDTSEAGAFTKSLVYLRGLRAIEKFMRNGGDMRRLYIGKITLEDLDIIQSIPDLQPPLLLPSFLREGE